jgi:hypothetical protein
MNIILEETETCRPRRKKLPKGSSGQSLTIARDSDVTPEVKQAYVFIMLYSLVDFIQRRHVILPFLLRDFFLFAGFNE